MSNFSFEGGFQERGIVTFIRLGSMQIISLHLYNNNRLASRQTLAGVPRS